VLQFNRHAALAVALLVVVAVVVGGKPGTTHPDWQADPCELHPIMQLVTVEVCASRINSPADAAVQSVPIASAAQTIAKTRMALLHRCPTFCIIARLGRRQ